MDITEKHFIGAAPGRSLLVLFVTIVLCAADRLHAADDPGRQQLYDLTPVSATNPIVASVKDCGIEIPVSELRAYVNAMPATMQPLDGSKRPPLTLKQKQASLQKLIDEHFLMWMGYQEKADQNPGIIHMLDVTKGMLLRETLVSREVGAKAKTPQEYEASYKKLCDWIFQQTDITVSSEAYDQLKDALKAVQSFEQTNSAATNSLSGLNKLPPAERMAVEDSIRMATQPSPLSKVPPAVRDNVFARCQAGYVTIGNVLECYIQIPPNRRPDLETPEGVNKILEPMFADSLLTQEARAQGLSDSPVVQEKLQLNRNMLVRLYALNQFGNESVVESHKPGEEARVRQWYQAHLKDRYTYKDSNGKDQVIPYEQQHERIENDYVDDLREQIREQHLAAIRKNHPVQIDDRLLKQITL